MEASIKLRSKLRATIFVAAYLVCISQSTWAQDRWSFEIRPGVNFATEKLGTANLDTGFGGEGNLAYRFMPHLSVYSGWSWNYFGSDQTVAGTKLDFEETGYTYGLQFIHPIGNSRINFLVRAGGLQNHIEVEKGNEVIFDSGHGFGWQAEGGLVIPIGEKWNFKPSARYRALSRDITIETVNSSIDLKYISVGGGVAYRF